MQHAFTVKYSGRVRALRTVVHICPPVDPEVYPTQVMKEYSAIWDTGATNSVITKKVVDDLDLRPISISEIHHAGGISSANVYLVNIGLPNKVMIPSVRVTEAPLTDSNEIPEDQRIGVLIGMDIIGAGDFAVTNKDEKTTMTFRIPSFDEIDFVPQAKEHNVIESGNREQKRSLKKRYKN